MNIKPRNIVTAIILSIITCGIYGIYWTIMMTREAVSVKDATDSAVLEILLMLFLPFVGFMIVEKKFSEGLAAQGIPHQDNSVLYLILGLVGLGIVPMCMIQSDLNKVAQGSSYSENRHPIGWRFFIAIIRTYSHLDIWGKGVYYCISEVVQMQKGVAK